MILEGYQRVRPPSLLSEDASTHTISSSTQYYGSTFRVAFFDRWLVIVSGPKLVDEILKLPDDEASFMESAEEVPPLLLTSKTSCAT